MVVLGSEIYSVANRRKLSHPYLKDCDTWGWECDR